MSLAETINNDIKEAMKAGEGLKLTVLRGLLANFNNALIDKRKKSGPDAALTEEDRLMVLQKEAKKRKEAFKAFKDGDRAELAKKEEEELMILSVYLPEQMSEEEVKTKIADLLKNENAENIGAAMKIVMAELKGKANGKLVSEEVKKHFSS